MVFFSLGRPKYGKDTRKMNLPCDELDLDEFDGFVKGARNEIPVLKRPRPGNS